MQWWKTELCLGAISGRCHPRCEKRAREQGWYDFAFENRYERARWMSWIPMCEISDGEAREEWIQRNRERITYRIE